MFSNVDSYNESNSELQLLCDNQITTPSLKVFSNKILFINKAFCHGRVSGSQDLPNSLYFLDEILQFFPL